MYDPSSSRPERVRVTRRHHPLIGEELEVCRGGKKRLTVRLPDGSRMWIPRTWTNACCGVEQTPSVGDAVCTTDSLEEFTRLLDALLERS